MKNLLPWQVIGMNLAALGTAISFAKFIFIPFGDENSKPMKPGFWPAVLLLLAGLFAANVVYYEAYSLANIAKPLATIALGWLAYLLIFQRSTLKLPRVAEQFEHLIGGMTLMLMALFWMVLA
jgi:multicomponent Na+:H+ antiporter subunit D